MLLFIDDMGRKILYLPEDISTQVQNAAKNNKGYTIFHNIEDVLNNEQITVGLSLMKAYLEHGIWLE